SQATPPTLPSRLRWKLLAAMPSQLLNARGEPLSGRIRISLGVPRTSPQMTDSLSADQPSRVGFMSGVAESTAWSPVVGETRWTSPFCAHVTGSSERTKATHLPSREY